MTGDDEDGFGSERDFMDALRVLKARSGLSYRDIAARMSRTDLLTVIAFVMWVTLPPGVVSFWFVWLGIIWPLPLAGLINWLGRDGRRRQAGLSDAPDEYLRMEYRDSRPPARPGLAGRWPG